MSGWIETPDEAAVRLRRLRAETGDWLLRYEWSHWVTLTVDGVWSADRLRRVLVDEFVRHATKVTQGPVPFAFVIEGGARGEQAHVHALLYGTAGLDCVRLERAWRHGRAKVTVYDPLRGAPYYLVKEVGGRAVDYGVSSRMPPLRRTETRQSAA